MLKNPQTHARLQATALWILCPTALIKLLSDTQLSSSAPVQPSYLTQVLFCLFLRWQNGQEWSNRMKNFVAWVVYLCDLAAGALWCCNTRPVHRNETNSLRLTGQQNKKDLGGLHFSFLKIMLFLWDNCVVVLICKVKKKPSDMSVNMNHMKKWLWKRFEKSGNMRAKLAERRELDII